MTWAATAVVIAAIGGQTLWLQHALTQLRGELKDDIRELRGDVRELRADIHRIRDV